MSIPRWISRLARLLLALILITGLFGCLRRSPSPTEQPAGVAPAAPRSLSTDATETPVRPATDTKINEQELAPVRTPPSHHDDERAWMVKQQLAARDIANQRVLEVMGRIPRHRFVPAGQQVVAYADSPLPIGHGQTISQPYIVALMTQLADPQPNAKALDVGTGSGYQAAVLAELVQQVFSVEIVEWLAQDAAVRLSSLGYQNVQTRHGDGYRGWPDEAPFDVIIVAAAADHVPQPLIDQLAPGGKLVIPVGTYNQELMVIEKASDDSITRRVVAPVAFVPMTGEAQQP